MNTNIKNELKNDYTFYNSTRGIEIQHDRTIYVVVDKAKTALEEIKQPGRHFQDSKGKRRQS